MEQSLLDIVFEMDEGIMVRYVSSNGNVLFIDKKEFIRKSSSFLSSISLREGYKILEFKMYEYLSIVN